MAKKDKAEDKIKMVRNALNNVHDTYLDVVDGLYDVIQDYNNRPNYYLGLDGLIPTVQALDFIEDERTRANVAYVVMDVLSACKEAANEQS